MPPLPAVGAVPPVLPPEPAVVIGGCGAVGASLEHATAAVTSPKVRVAPSWVERKVVMVSQRPRETHHETFNRLQSSLAQRSETNAQSRGAHYRSRLPLAKRVAALSSFLSGAQSAAKQ
jgi:hypothetical protein